MATRHRDRSGRPRRNDGKSGNRSGRQNSGQNGSGQGRRHRDEEGIVPVLAREVRRVEGAVERGRVTSMDRTTFQAIALLARRERARVRAEATVESRRDAELKRLDGIAAILARIAASDPSFFELLDEDAEISSGSRAIMREMQRKAGMEPDPEKPAEPEPGTASSRAPRGAAFGGGPPARQPVHGARLLRRHAAADHATAGRLGADRATAERLRAPGSGGSRVHGAAGSHQRAGSRAISS